MTSANLLARVRTILDEASASFWTDTEIYSALTDAQFEITSLALQLYKAKIKIKPNMDLPDILRPLITLVSGTIPAPSQATVNLPADFMFLIGGKYRHDSSVSLEVPFYIKDITPQKFFQEGNTYLISSTSTEYYAFLNAGTIEFSRPSTGSASYSIHYLKEPTEISGATNPIIPDFAHSALIEFASARMLIKDGKYQEANLHNQNFLEMIQKYIGI